ncbi:MAG TPA: lysozyme inhibitor LprI family protein [Candidatus Udaeobacter sp.]|nr:lysozyme inhibitor LprI family protein [Candidatus Udaeobacter sp.]
MLSAIAQAEDEVAPERIVGASPSGNHYIKAGGSNKIPQLVVVSASDPKVSVLPSMGGPTDENITFNQVFISPDETWISASDNSCSAHLYHRSVELRYEPASPPCLLESAFHFLSAQERIDEKLIGMRTDADMRSINFVDWSSDSRRLLLALSASVGPPEEGSGGNIFKKGIGWWLCYFNTGTGKFELTDRLRAANRDARKRWDGYYGASEASATMPLSAEPVGQEGAWTPATLRFERADKRLNETYSELQKKLDQASREQLKQNQREWLIERDTDAVIHANQRWSPFGAAALMEGKAIATEVRAADLEKQLKP